MRPSDAGPDDAIHNMNMTAKPARTAITAVLLLVLNISTEAAAQAWPSRPIRMIAPISAGGGADVAARLLAKSMGETLKQQVVVENRPGGGSVLGTTAAAAATADGHTLLWISGAHAINAAFNRNLPYDSIKSFEPVGLFAKMPFVLVVHPGMNAKTVPELLALVRASPGKYNYASSGIGSASHLGLEMLKLGAKLDMVNISYKGAAPSLAGLIGGEVQMAMLGPLSVKPHIASGKVRPLAVTTAKRSAAFPGLPALGESVPQYEMTSWYGMLVPRGTPPAVIARLNAAMTAAQSDKPVIDGLAAEGAELPSTTPQAFRKYLEADIARYVALRQKLDIKLE
ncbi:MAG: tripartite tricarboxylate transporter substrate binding protein [Burkholderiales bacterium]|nr:tripartite tricarboxylate transporter substrate binding protein [Burkholderiales bacterium]